MVFCLFVVVCFVSDLFHIELSPGRYWRGLRSQEVVGLGWGALYLALHCHPQQDFGIKMASNKCHFNVSLTVRAKQQDDVHQRKPLKREDS